jgi:hypothetical protein
MIECNFPKDVPVTYWHYMAACIAECVAKWLQGDKAARTPQAISQTFEAFTLPVFQYLELADQGPALPGLPAGYNPFVASHRFELIQRIGRACVPEWPEEPELQRNLLFKWSMAIANQGKHDDLPGLYKDIGCLTGLQAFCHQLAQEAGEAAYERVVAF